MVKTLILDIETSPIMGKVWSLWEQNLSLDQIENDWFIMSYAAKWLDGEDIYYNDCRENIGEDFELLSDLHGLLSEADIVVAHNGDKFDIPKINARLLLNGLPPPSPYKTIDTLKMAKRTFKFTSNKLAYLTDALCSNKKQKHVKFAGWTLWNECMAGNNEAWDEMYEYNCMDVISLEELYLILRPWMPNHPTIGAFDDLEVCSCPKCNSSKVVKRGFFHTSKGKYQRYICTDCGGWSSATTTINTKEKRQSLLASR
jgi:DNA polymerase elongation subunit (family B)